MTLRKEVWLISFSAVLAVLGLSGCSDSGEVEEVSPVSVRTEAVSRSLKSASSVYTGVVKESESVSLGFPVSGTVQSVLVDEGESVCHGAVVARLDRSVAGSALEAARATLEQAEDAFGRMEMLHSSASLPDMKMAEVKSRLQQAQAAYAIAQKNYDDCELKAPCSGVVGRKFLSAGATALPGQAVCTLLDIDKVKVKVSVPETEVSGIQPSHSVQIKVPALGGEVFHGAGIEKGVEADPLAHTYDVYVTVDNRSHRLLSGMVCSVTLSPQGEESALLVPVTAVCSGSGGRRFVWVADGGAARRVYVQTGDAVGNRVEITSGLSGGELVITEGFQKVSEGSKIKY